MAVGVQSGVGAEQGLGFPTPGRVAQEQPAQEDDGLARVVPEGRAGGGLETLPGAVGPTLAQGGPDRGGVGQHGLQGGLAGAHDPGPPPLSRSAGRGRIMEDGIQAQPGQEGDGRGSCSGRRPAASGSRRSGRRRPPAPGRAASGAGGTASGGPSP